MREVVENILLEIAPAKLIAVSKYTTDEKIIEAYNLGIRDFGESKVQDLQAKSLRLNLPEIRWHFIGHLQSNKVSALLKVKNLVSIHSVHSFKILELLLQKELLLTSTVNLFLEIKTTNEEEKSGLKNEAEIEEAIGYFKKISPKHFALKGLMTMGPIRTDDFIGDTKKSFQKLQEYSQKFEKQAGPLELSMGMSDDYLIAKEFGTSWVRIGSKIFG